MEAPNSPHTHSTIWPLSRLVATATPAFSEQNRGLRFLSLDGGGVRGFATLLLLQQCLEKAGNSRPCDYFDMIGGTSTGGLIAIMLGCLRMDIQECIFSYLEMMDYVFKKPLNNTRVNVLTGNIRSRYSQERLKTAILKVIQKSPIAHGQEPTQVRLRQHDEPGCRVFVVATNANTSDSEILSNYTPRHGEQQPFFYGEIKIWEAALATCAATSFFEPVVITYGISKTFVDGAFISNNPVWQVYNQAKREFPQAASGIPFEDQIRSFLSIGTNDPSPRAIHDAQRLGNAYAMVQTLTKLATQTRNTEQDFAHAHLELRIRDAFFRLNPPYMDDIGLEDAKQKDRIADLTNRYGRTIGVEEMLIKFGRAAGRDQRTLAAVIAPVTYSRLLFTDLNRSSKYFHRGYGSYWSHFTLESHLKYEEMWNQLCRLHRGLGGNGSRKSFIFNQFQLLFDSDNPGEDVARSVWSRLLRLGADIDTALFPKGFIIAVIYMLHIESVIPDYRPAMEHRKLPGDQREVCKCFGRWVRCHCSAACEKMWNFANRTGIGRDGLINVKCLVEKVVKKQIKANTHNKKELEAERAWLETRRAWETRS